MFILYRKRTW